MNKIVHFVFRKHSQSIHLLSLQWNRSDTYELRDMNINKRKLTGLSTALFTIFSLLIMNTSVWAGNKHKHNEYRNYDHEYRTYTPKVNHYGHKYKHYSYKNHRYHGGIYLVVPGPRLGYKYKHRPYRHYHKNKYYHKHRYWHYPKHKPRHRYPVYKHGYGWW